MSVWNICEDGKQDDMRLIPVETQNDHTCTVLLRNWHLAKIQYLHTTQFHNSIVFPNSHVLHSPPALFQAVAWVTNTFEWRCCNSQFFLLIFLMLFFLAYSPIISDSCQLGKRLITFVMPLLLGWGTYWIDKNSFSSLIFSLSLFSAPTLAFPLTSLLSALPGVCSSDGGFRHFWVFQGGDGGSDDST